MHDAPVFIHRKPSLRSRAGPILSAPRAARRRVQEGQGARNLSRGHGRAPREACRQYAHLSKRSCSSVSTDSCRDPMQGGCALNAHAASCLPPDQVVGRTAAAPGVGAAGVQGHATLFSTFTTASIRWMTSASSLPMRTRHASRSEHASGHGRPPATRRQHGLSATHGRAR